MKIKKLVLQNINSLYGKWEIDFDCEKFRQSGIFAVTGKTGSGKSSILDAMCLALYGTTPRLKKDTAEAVSRGCKECMCELTFCDTNNREWIATYGYEMITRGENKGKMKSEPLHRLSCNGKTEAEKTTKVRKMVEEITGLDFERFCRAVLLAQGSFDAFLNAGRDNGEILERITGTEIYSRIADTLRERYNSEKGKLAAIEAQFAGIDIMSDEEAAALDQSVAHLTGEIDSFNAEYQTISALAEKFNQLELHTAALKECSDNEALLAAEELEFTAGSKRLEDGKKVLEADSKYQPLKELLNQQSVASASLLKSEQLLAQQKTLLEENRKKLDAVSADTQKFETEFAALSAILTAVNQLDTIIKTLDDAVNSADKKRRAEVAGALACRSELAAANAALSELEKQHSEDAGYLASHAKDGELVSLQKICTERLEDFKKYSLECAGNKQKKTAVNKELDALQKSFAKKEKELQEVNEKFNTLSAADSAAKQNLTDMLEGSSKEHWQTLLDTQEKCYNQAVLLKSMEDHRKQLKDGEACPLCGATEHPFAAGNVPEPDKEEQTLQSLKQRLTAISKAEKEIQEIAALINACSNTRLQHENALEQLKIQQDAKKRELETVTEAESTCQENLARLSAKIDQSLAPFDLSWDKENCALSNELEQRIKRFDECTASQSRFEEKADACRDNILRLRTALKALKDNCRSFKAEWQNEKQKLAGETAKRLALFGTKDPAVEAAAAEADRKELAAKREAAQNAFTGSSANCTRSSEDICKLKDTLKELDFQIISARENFIFACNDAGVTEAEFHASVLTKEELTQLSARDADLRARRKQLSNTRQNCEKDIKALETFLADKSSKEEVTAKQQTVYAVIQEKREELGAIRQKITQNNEAKEKMAEQRKKLLEQKKAMEVWNRLYELIGAKDKFQRFAQGITLEHLLVLANQELEKLSGRYRLLRSQDEELGIDVADKDQGDEIRGCKTLSGGERFLVSLSLALGLSRMAGEKIRVDSLFLDEGFGTLDAETLETALEALSNLRNRGKLVGVISHVTALSERIPCIIEVNKSGGGRSTLSGTGVNRC